MRFLRPAWGSNSPAVYDGSGGGAFTPASLSPDLWFEAAQSALYESNAGSGAQPSANGDPVGYMTDLSGNGRHVSSLANDTTRPTLNGVGSKPYLAFAAASSQTLVRATGLGFYANGAMSVFVAWNPNPVTSARFFSEGNSASSNTIECWLQASSTNATQSSVFIRGDDASNPNVQPVVSALTGSWNNTNQTYGMVWDGSSITGYLNGSSDGSNSLASGGGTVTTDRFSIGSLYRSTSANFFTANLYGLVAVKRALNSTEISNLSTYLAALM